ncbi:uncharacterized protein LODBEIA_P39560 [Lodderomyces beijingensis]|uniref:SBE2/SBE22 middle domain-containing protein n=1 Tax=Lodderomyces beijingensis TaxID=1775926 RepID=A0ABP0ZNN5_9ASCO
MSVISIEDSSNSQNLYDIALISRRNSSNSKIHRIGSSSNIVQQHSFSNPKRVVSASSLSPLEEDSCKLKSSNGPYQQHPVINAKRPGDYYIQKIHSKSSLNLPRNPPPSTPISSLSMHKPKQPSSSQSQQQQQSQHQNLPLDYKKRMSQDSLTSFQSSISDDHSSILSCQFDTPTPSSCSQLTQFSSTSGGKSVESRICSMSSTSSTTVNTIAEIEPTNPAKKRPSPSLKSASTINVLNDTFILPKPPTIKSNRSKSMAAIPTIDTKSKSTTTMPMLNRSKSKFMSLQESKERQILRKKKYEENDLDDEILSNGLDHLIFNVPVVKNQNMLYSLKGNSSVKLNGNESSSSNSSATILSRSDLVNEGDKYNIRPCPLPGRLSTTNLPQYHGNPNESILEESEESEETAGEGGGEGDSSILTDDSIIAHNISELYSQHSASVSKLMKMTREQNLMYKLPSYIKSQSSLDDLHLISPEKLTYLDQTRPINLPPKSPADKTRHNKQFSCALDSFQITIQSEVDSRFKNAQSKQVKSQQWISIINSLLNLDPKQFTKKFTTDKNQLRKLTWDCNVPMTHTFQFFIKILSNNHSSQDSINTIRHSFELFDCKLQNNITETMKQNKDAEFSKIVSLMSTQPLVSNSGINMVEFRQKMMHLLYIKSISESGLCEKDTLLISILLTLFPSVATIDLYCLLELIQHEILNSSFLQTRLGSNNSGDCGDDNEMANFTTNHLLMLMLRFNDHQKLTSLALRQQPQQQPRSPHPLQRESTPNEEETFREIKSSSVEIVMKLFTLLIINSQSTKSRVKNNIKLVKAFTRTVFVNYHLGWNTFDDLLESEDGDAHGSICGSSSSIRINHSHDQLLNMDKFVGRWAKHHFG